MPVDIGSIDRELKKLWDEGQGALSRASLVNFAIYCRGREAMARNTELISKLMQNHACRAVLIGVEEGGGGEAHVDAWINAHCHITREGAKQVCCEQISFLLHGDAAGLVPNIVFSHLDSDLPLYLWWQGDFTDLCSSATDCFLGMDRPEGFICQVAEAGSRCASGSDLWPWVDRLFFDSRDFTEPRKQFCYLRTSILRRVKGADLSGKWDLSPGSERMALCDLNWVRSLCLRQAIAQIFEDPENLAQLKNVTKASLTYAPGYRCTAALVAGWMSSQLGWEFTGAQANILAFDGHALELCEKEGAPISGWQLECKADPASGATISLLREGSSAYWHADICLPGGCEHHHLFPAGDPDTLALLDEELMLGGKHLVYLKALAIAESLF